MLFVHKAYGNWPVAQGAGKLFAGSGRKIRNKWPQVKRRGQPAPCFAAILCRRNPPGTALTPIFANPKPGEACSRLLAIWWRLVAGVGFDRQNERQQRQSEHRHEPTLPKAEARRCGRKTGGENRQCSRLMPGFEVLDGIEQTQSEQGENDSSHDTQFVPCLKEDVVRVTGVGRKLLLALSPASQSLPARGPSCLFLCRGLACS